MADCTAYQEQISGYIDGTLTAEEQTDLMAHLAVCTSCRSLLQLYEEMHTVLQEDTVTPPVTFTNDVMAQIHALPAKRAASHTKRHTVRRFLTAAACFAVIILAASQFSNLKNLFWNGWKSRSPDTAAASEAAYAMPAGAPDVLYDDAELAGYEESGEETPAEQEQPMEQAPPAISQNNEQFADSSKSFSAGGPLDTDGCCGIIYMTGNIPALLENYTATPAEDGSDSQLYRISYEDAVQLVEAGYEMTTLTEDQTEPVLVILTP